MSADHELIALDLEAIADRFAQLRRGRCVVQNPGDDWPMEVRVSCLGDSPDHPDWEKWGLTKYELATVLGIEPW